MKKILKSFRQALLSEDNSNKPSNEKPQEKLDFDFKEIEVAADVSVEAIPSQNNTPSVKPKVKRPAVKPKDAVQADKHECFPQRQLHRNCCRLFLGGLPDNIAETEVRKVFENYGKVIDIVIPFDKDTNKPKRYGYMEFENENSARACLEDHYVTIGGRRVEVKKAWPRGAPRREENCDKKENKGTGYYEKYLSCPKDLESSLESLLSSTDSESNKPMENKQLLYQKLFEDYFKAKFFLQNLLGPDTGSNAVLSEEIKKQQENEEKVEKILKGLYITSKEDSSEEEDNGDFSGDTDDTNSTFDESEYSVHDLFGSTTSDQTKNVPVFMKDAERRVCSLCKWAPLDNSAEGFLAHCRTLGHKQKLRERFKKGATPDDSQNRTSTQASPRNNNRSKQNYQKRGRNQRKRFLSKNEKKNNKKGGNLVLEEIISSVVAKTEKCIKCRICNKTIPLTADIRILMVNLSHHLQSKGHLAKISELEKFQGKSKNVPAKKINVKMDASKNEKTTPGEKKHKYLKNAEISKNFAETTKQSKTNISSKSEELICKSESISPSNTSVSIAKVGFCCLLCNYFCSQAKTFLSHLNSEFHFANDKQTSRSSLKTSSLESVWSNLTNCLNCNIYLYGCSNSIKNHLTKCKYMK